MPTFEEIYAAHADDYDRLVEREDHQGNVIAAIRAIHSLDNASVVELGAGTGRITRQLVPLVKSICAFDASAHMLSVARNRLEKTGFTNWSLEVADNAALPGKDATVDIAIAGWSFGHQTAWAENQWQDTIGAAVHEMLRVLRPGGSAIVLETLGTGVSEPAPPNDTLAAYYDWLENRRGFQKTWIRTDYKFASIDEGVELFRFFFGEGRAQRVLDSGSAIVPECTGVWYLTNS
jgi:ubiquinone/menaquinone biosynthesis C-methylase UbiE